MPLPRALAVGSILVPGLPRCPPAVHGEGRRGQSLGQEWGALFTQLVLRRWPGRQVGVVVLGPQTCGQGAEKESVGSSRGCWETGQEAASRAIEACDAACEWLCAEGVDSRASLL